MSLGFTTGDKHLDDFLSGVDNLTRAQRGMRFKDSPQITLGELISKLEATRDNHEKYVEFDFEYLRPKGVHSWRGAYHELAIDFEPDVENSSTTKLDDFIKILKEAVGSTFTGWKGGDYVMSEETPVWVSRPGMGANTAVIGVHDASYKTVILTTYSEY